MYKRWRDLLLRDWLLLLRMRLLQMLSLLWRWDRLHLDVIGSRHLQRGCDLTHVERRGRSFMCAHVTNR